MERVEFEAYLRENLSRGVIDFTLRAHETANGSVEFYIHPQNHDGTTPDYRVFGNRLTQVNYEEKVK